MYVPAVFLSLVLFATVSFCQNKNVGTVRTDSSGSDSNEEIIRMGREAYIYGYPLVMMEISKRVMTNFGRPNSMGAPINQIARKEEFVDDKFTFVVKPNSDTYYAWAWLDLSHEPLVLEVPNTLGRYFLIPILDAWTNVISSPGKRTTGCDAQSYLITGPAWMGKVPPQLTEIHSPTAMAWMVARTQVNNAADGADVVKNILDGYRLTPLSKYGKRYNPPVNKVDTGISMKPPVRQVSEMAIEEYFNLLNKLMISNPPSAADSLILKRITFLGIAPGSTFDLTKFSPAVRDSLRLLPLWGKTYLRDLGTKRERVNGWVTPRGLGKYGNHYNVRAMVANKGLGANLDADVMYASTAADSGGEKYDGSSHNYVLHFDEGRLPPANAFWSVTMYNSDNMLVANTLNRFAISNKEELQKNADGSIDIFIQKDYPGKDKELNWLPAPDGPFNLMLRIYWPKEGVLNGSWIPPAVVKTE